MRTPRPQIATSLSWIGAVLMVSSCVAPADPDFCGDDAYYPAGLDVHLGGAADTETYQIDVVADGAAFSLTQPPGGDDSYEVVLDDGPTLRARVQWTENYPLENRGSLLSIWYAEPPDESAWGPTTAALTVTMQGEAIEHMLVPTYTRTERWGPSCRGTEHAFEIVSVPTP